MPKEVDPKNTTRAAAYALWMKAPNPMVTFFKTFDVTNLIRVSRKRKLKFNMLMDYCIGGAAAGIKEFYILPVGEIDGAVGMNSGIFNNPFIIWGRYRKKWFRYYLSLSFQFHHTQMDGAHAGAFLERVQTEINRLK